MWADEVKKLVDYCPDFKGVFSLDTLPPIESNMSFIFNTDVANLPGTHWVAVYVKHGSVYFFDSYGRTIKNFGINFQRHIKNFAKDYEINIDSRLLQSPFSDSCGYWCVFYIFCKTCDIDGFYKYFSENLNFNEEILNYFFQYFNLM